VGRENAGHALLVERRDVGAHNPDAQSRPPNEQVTGLR
jgi:hypothetical protein